MHKFSDPMKQELNELYSELYTAISEEESGVNNPFVIGEMHMALAQVLRVLRSNTINQTDFDNAKKAVSYAL